jgi:hypothetical protein
MYRNNSNYNYNKAKINASILKSRLIILIAALVVSSLFVSIMVSGTFSFAVRTTTTHNSESAITKSVPLHRTTNAVVAHNANLKKSTTDPCSSMDFYWNHVYDSKRLKDSPSPLGSCITVTGKVYSKVGGGTEEDKDGDLHFTLQLDPNYTHYSNKYDCRPGDSDYKQCLSHPDKIVVEVICYKQPDQDYKSKWGDYCKGVERRILPNGPPSQGEPLSVSGKFVTDTDSTVQPPSARHDPWNEIHPATDVHHI